MKVEKSERKCYVRCYSGSQHACQVKVNLCSLQIKVFHAQLKPFLLWCCLRFLNKERYVNVIWKQAIGSSSFIHQLLSIVRCESFCWSKKAIKWTSAERRTKCRVSFHPSNRNTPHRSASLSSCHYKHVCAIMHETSIDFTELVEEISICRNQNLLKAKKENWNRCSSILESIVLFETLIMRRGTVTTTYWNKLYATYWWMEQNVFNKQYMERWWYVLRYEQKNVWKSLAGKSFPCFPFVDVSTRRFLTSNVSFFPDTKFVPDNEK